MIAYMTSHAKEANKRINSDNLLRCASQIAGYTRRYNSKQDGK